MNKNNYKVVLTQSDLLVQTMDISKMDAGDASFTTPFKLVAKRDDYIHALVAYFDVSFTKCHKLMGFSTGEFLCPSIWMVLDDIIGLRFHEYF